MFLYNITVILLVEKRLKPLVSLVAIFCLDQDLVIEMIKLSS